MMVNCMLWIMREDYLNCTPNHEETAGVISEHTEPYGPF
jgi:hypothetical protein